MGRHSCAVSPGPPFASHPHNPTRQRKRGMSQCEYSHLSTLLPGREASVQGGGDGGGIRRARIKTHHSTSLARPLPSEEIKKKKRNQDHRKRKESRRSHQRIQPASGTPLPCPSATGPVLREGGCGVTAAAAAECELGEVM